LSVSKNIPSSTFAKHLSFQSSNRGCFLNNISRSKTEEIYAVKIIKVADEELKYVSQNEFKLVRSIKHPNIIKMKDIFYNEGNETIYIVME
jgi:serine/threonine protein kinase